jgi:hypothetical protein
MAARKISVSHQKTLIHQQQRCLQIYLQKNWHGFCLYPDAALKDVASLRPAAIQ